MTISTIFRNLKQMIPSFGLQWYQVHNYPSAADDYEYELLDLDETVFLIYYQNFK